MPDIELFSKSLQKVHAGDKVSLTFANGVKKTYTVKGIFHTQFIQTDLQAYLHQKEMETVNPLVTDKASVIHIKTAKGADTSNITNQIANIQDGIRVMMWEDQAGIVHSLTESFNVINAILNVVNLLVAGVTVFIVTYIDVTSRKRQIGIQRAIGITPASITLSYVIRALAYTILALALAFLIYTYGIIPLEARYPFHFPFGNVYLRVVPAFMIRTAWMLVGVAVVAALVPVQMVMRTKIIDAIWG
jgi:ABC-type antimicrobial peptide transport system permease subunit